MINYLKGVLNDKTDTLQKIIDQRIPYSISPYTYQEVLQGARNEAEFAQLKAYFSTLRIIFLPDDIKTYERAARLFFDLRRNGVTIRSTIDILIALTAIENELSLLHDDRDFDLFSEKIAALKVLRIL